MTQRIQCMKCKTILSVPPSLPDRVTCPTCRTVLGVPKPTVPKPTVQPKPRPTPPAAIPVNPPATPVRAAVQTQPVPTGTQVAGHIIKRELARGGLGIVYLASHPHFNELRAIKRPMTNNGIPPEVLLGRFRREVQAVGGLRHPNIIGAYDAGEDAEGPYLVLEYLDGETLSSLVNRHRQLPVAEACELVRQAALGLQASHSANLIHRDIKPSNLMLTRTASGARVVILDWGLVKRSDQADPVPNQLTKIHTDLGTPDFISPEQIRNPSEVDIRADIYSLGVTLFTLLTGRPPFADKSVEQKQVAHVREGFPPMTNFRTDVPAGVLTVLERMVKKNPAERFATPGELAEALKPFASDEGQLQALFAPTGVESGFQTTPVGSGNTVPNTVSLPSNQATVLAPRNQPSLSENLKRIHPMWMAIAGGVLAVFLLLMIVIVFWPDSKEEDKNVADKDPETETNKDSKPDTSKLVFIDENFQNIAKDRNIPPKWTNGDDFRIEEYQGEKCLGSSKNDNRPHSVTLPPVKLKGNFYVEGIWTVGSGSSAFHFEGPNSTKPLTVAFDYYGNVHILKESYSPRPGYKRYTPYNFSITRTGSRLKVLINGELVATKEMGTVTEFDTMKLWMHGYYTSKVFRLKVGNLPQQE